MATRNTATATAETTNQTADATEVTAPVKAKAQIVVEALKIPVKLPMKQESISVMAICSDKRYSRFISRVLELNRRGIFWQIRTTQSLNKRSTGNPQ